MMLQIWECDRSRRNLLEALLRTGTICLARNPPTRVELSSGVLSLKHDRALKQDPAPSVLDYRGQKPGSSLMTSMQPSCKCSV